VANLRPSPDGADSRPKGLTHLHRSQGLTVTLHPAESVHHFLEQWVGLELNPQDARHDLVQHVVAKKGEDINIGSSNRPTFAPAQRGRAGRPVALKSHAVSLR